MSHKLLGFLEEGGILLEMQASTKVEAIQELLAVVVERGGVDEAKRAAVFEAIVDREKRGSTGLGEGLAVPHVKDCEHVEGLTGAFGRSKTGLPFDAIDGQPVDICFLILGGEGTADDHVSILRNLATARQNPHFLRFLREAEDQSAVADIIREMTGSVA